MRIHRSAADPDFVMQMRSRHSSGAAHRADLLAAPHVLAVHNGETGKMRVIGLDRKSVV